MMTLVDSKVAAHRLVTRALKAGAIEKEHCWICDEREAEAHHPDYEKYDEIQWLCHPCHRKIHRGAAGMKCNRPPLTIHYRPKKWPPKPSSATTLTEPITYNVSKDTLRRATKQAVKEQRTLSNICRIALDDYLEKAGS